MVHVEASISVADASFLGTALEGVFYGIFVVLYGVFRHIRSKRNSRDYFTGSITLLFVLCSVYFATDLAQQYVTLLPDAENPEVAYRINIVGSILFSLVDFVAQMILIVRCYLLYERKWWVPAIPALMAFGALGGELGMVGLLGSVAPENVVTVVDRIVTIGLTSFSLSLAVNTLTTCLIITRILMMSRDIGTMARGKHIRTAVALIAESGLLIFAVQLIYVVLFSLEQHPAWYLINGPTTQIYGITPTILAVRVGMGSSYESTAVNSATSSYGSHKDTKAMTSRPGGISVEFQSVTHSGDYSVGKV